MYSAVTAVVSKSVEVTVLQCAGESHGRGARSAVRQEGQSLSPGARVTSGHLASLLLFQSHFRMADKVFVLLVTGCFALRTENKDWEGGGRLAPHRYRQCSKSCIVGPVCWVVLCVSCAMCFLQMFVSISGSLPPVMKSWAIWTSVNLTVTMVTRAGR